MLFENMVYIEICHYGIEKYYLLRVKGILPAGQAAERILAMFAMAGSDLPAGQAAERGPIATTPYGCVFDALAVGAS